MPTGNKFISIAANSGSAVAFDSTDTNNKDVHFSCSLASYVVFEQADASAAATAIGSNPVTCAAGVVYTFYGIKPSTTWVRSQSASATAGSFWFSKGG
jgi:hypothetical protein